MALEDRPPGPQLWGCPVPVNSAYDRYPVFRGLLENLPNQCGSGIVTIDKESQRSLGVFERISDCLWIGFWAVHPLQTE